MSYHDLSESTLTEDERLVEATRILERLTNFQDLFTPNELKFVEQMYDATSVSVKQLFWLRDIDLKYQD